MRSTAAYTELRSAASRCKQPLLFFWRLERCSLAFLTKGEFGASMRCRRSGLNAAPKLLALITHLRILVIALRPAFLPASHLSSPFRQPNARVLLQDYECRGGEMGWHVCHSLLSCLTSCKWGIKGCMQTRRPEWQPLSRSAE